jgi:DNA-binding YbaB/EbfC family protein
MADHDDPRPSERPERLDPIAGGPLDPAADRPEVVGPLAGLGRPDPFGDPLAEAGGFDLSSLFDSAQQLVAAQQEAARQELVGRAGGGKVEVEVTGGGEFRRVRISPDVVDPDDVTMLEDLVLAALHDAMAQVNQAQASALGGLDMGDLGGLLGNG